MTTGEHPQPGQVWHWDPERPVTRRRVLAVHPDGSVEWERPFSTLKSVCTRAQWLKYVSNATLESQPIPATDDRRVKHDWPTIDPLLGTMTDAALSKQTGVPELTILRRRKRLGVRSFAHQRIIDGAVNPLPRFMEKARIRPDLSSVCPFVRERRKSCKSP